MTTLLSTRRSRLGCCCLNGCLISLMRRQRICPRMLSMKPLCVQFVSTEDLIFAIILPCNSIFAGAASLASIVGPVCSACTPMAGDGIGCEGILCTDSAATSSLFSAAAPSPSSAIFSVRKLLESEHEEGRVYRTRCDGIAHRKAVNAAAAILQCSHFRHEPCRCGVVAERDLSRQYVCRCFVARRRRQPSNVETCFGLRRAIHSALHRTLLCLDGYDGKRTQ